jgi:hypothetical protein
MAEALGVYITPIGGDDEDLSHGACSAVFFRQEIEWQKHALMIKWNAKERLFYVEFTGKGQIDVGLSDLLSTRVPLRIARSSHCVCGSPLELGDYSISTENDDFAFRGEFFCPSCSTRLAAERKGIKRVLETWFSGLKRIEVGTTGFGIERL